MKSRIELKDLVDFWKSLGPVEKIAYATFVVSALATACLLYEVVIEGKQLPVWYVP
jgi:hypothetical protein